MPPNEKVTSIQDELFENDEEEKIGTADIKDPLSLPNLEKKHKGDMMNQYRVEMGFTLVIEEMINSKKPLVGHNCIYDMCFLYDQFIAPLPNTFNEFSKNWRENFSAIYDSKYIACQYVGNLFQTTQL